MYNNLTQNQLEQAFQWLASPVQEPPPPELEALSQQEWFLLQRLLDSLMRERVNNVLH